MRQVSAIATAVLFFALFLSPPVFSADETVTITTYYPSPNGSYRDLHSSQMGVGADYQNSVLQSNSLVVQGNIGIGTTVPSAKLEVTGSGVSGIDYITKVVGNNGADNLSTVYDYTASVWRLRSGGTNSPPIAFNMGSGEKMRITNAGNVGIGTNNPQARLDLSDTGNVGAIRIGNDTGPCNSGRAGSIRYNGEIMQYCNGTTWGPIAAIPCDWTGWKGALTFTVRDGSKYPSTYWTTIFNCSGGVVTEIKYMQCSQANAAPYFADINCSS